MKRKERLELKEATDRFNRCKIRTIDFEPVGKLSDGKNTGAVGLVKSFEEKRDSWGGTRYGIIGYLATLSCPRTEDQKVDISSDNIAGMQRPAALDSVRKLAADMVCRGCVYADMSPAAVSIERASYARAETERLEAFALRCEAVAELESKGISFSAEDNILKD